MRWYPLKFRPIFKQRIWGGRRLEEVFGKDLPEGQLIGESWELVDLPGDRSIVANGQLAGRAIADVVATYPLQVTGRPEPVSPFPLLIKFLDAQDILSVQVHPDNRVCKRLGIGQPKSECWYIVDAGPGAFIYKGLRPGITRRQLELAMDKGSVEQVLQKVPVEPGQCHYLPAGTVHALGPGILVAEIQIPSDTTFRLYDFDRLDNTGQPRPLHVREALESIRFDILAEELTVTTSGRLVDSPQFVVDKIVIPAGEQALLGRGIMRVLVLISGAGCISDPAGRQLTEVKAGQCLLIPASYEGVVIADKDMEYLTVMIEGKG